MPTSTPAQQYEINELDETGPEPRIVTTDPVAEYESNEKRMEPDVEQQYERLNARLVAIYARDDYDLPAMRDERSAICQEFHRLNYAGNGGTE